MAGVSKIYAYPKGNRLCRALRGRYAAVNEDGVGIGYSITLDVEESEGLYIFRVVDFEGLWGASLLDLLFDTSGKFVIRKDGVGHMLRKWADGSFTLYPFQAGIAYHFKRMGMGTGT